jgi:hypothetical protein
MPVSAGFPDIVHVIQLAVAPVFLLSGVGVTISVLISRLARIIDRARLLEDRLPGAAADQQARIHEELTSLSGRARMVNVALTLSTTCALLVCVVIALLFVGSVLGVDLGGVIALLFVAAMLAMVGGLSIFLREIFIGTASLRIGKH